MGPSFPRKYATGSGADIYIPIVKRNVVDFALSADWTPASGDVKVSKDGGSAASIGTLPTAVTMGNTAMWKFVFSDSELTCKILSVTVSDSATKAVEDQMFNIETYGHASAMYPTDFSAAVLQVKLADTAHGGSTAVLTLERLIAASTTTNEPAFKLTGNGTAAGLLSTGGSSGPGMKLSGGSTGDGLLLVTTTGDGISSKPGTGHALNLEGGGATKQGINCLGSAAAGGAPAGDGVRFIGGSATTSGGGTAGRGLNVIGGGGAATTNAAGAGFLAVSGVNGGAGGSDAMKTIPSGTGVGFVGDIQGSLSGSVNSVFDATSIRNAVTGGAYALSTDASGMIRVVDGTGTGEINTLSGNIVQVNQLGTQAKADVNAEVLDVINVDTYAEPGQSAPGATITLAAKLNFIYKGWRNKITQNATTLSLFNDAGSTVDQKATVSDDGTTFTRGKIGTGP